MLRSFLNAITLLPKNKGQTNSCFLLLVIKCMELHSPTSGTSTCSGPLGSSSYGATCQFACDEGYTLDGPSTLQCEASGLWSSSQPSCVGMSTSTDVKTQTGFIIWRGKFLMLTSSVSPLYSRPVSYPPTARERHYELRWGRGDNILLWKHLQLHLCPGLQLGRAERGDVHISGRME